MFENVLCTINCVGHIDRWIGDDIVQRDNPIYAVVFVDHSLENPTCEHFDLETPIELEINEQNDKIFCSYTKKIDMFSLKTMIIISPTSIEWTIKINGEFPNNYRFGVVYPCKKDSIFTNYKNRQISTPIGNFFSCFEKNYRDQTLLTIPIISIDANSPMTFMCSMDTNIQFFTYTGGIRITASTSTANQFKSSIHNTSFNHSLKSYYFQHNPRADKIINKWKSLLSKAQNRFGLSVHICSQEDAVVYNKFAEKYFFNSPSENEVEIFCTLLIEELSKYCSYAFQELSIDAIYLAKNIKFGKNQTTRPIHGAAFPTDCSTNWILFDLRYNDKRVIHHEIFHYIRRKVTTKLPTLDSKSVIKSQINASTLHVDQYTDEECYADLFGLYMINSDKLQQWEYQGILNSNTLQILENIANDYVDKDWLLNHRKSELLEERVVYKIVDNGVHIVQFGKLEKADAFAIQKQNLPSGNHNKTENKHLLLLGTNYVGLSLLAGILNSSPEIQVKKISIDNLNIKSDPKPMICLLPITIKDYEKHGINILDKLTSLIGSYNFVQLIRDPLVCVSYYVANYEISSKFAFQYWCDVNTILWYLIESSKGKTIRYEDLLLSPEPIIKNLCSQMSISYLEQYLHYGDFPQFETDSRSFCYGKINVELIDPHPKPDFEEWGKYRQYDICNFLNYKEG